MEMKFCAACSMPLESSELIGLETGTDAFCIHCVDDNKAVRSCADIFNGGIQFFMQHVGLDQALAERVTRKNMNMLPYWQDKRDTCLDGEVASEAEFAAVLAKLQA